MAGITRREQWALMGVIGLVLLGLAVQQWRRADAVSAALVDPASGTWQTLATLEVTPNPVAAAASAITATAASSLPTTATAAVLQALASPAAPSGLIDLNLATASDLETLPGIGPAKAAAILATRTRLGAFSSVDQLDEVSGFGAKTLDRLRPLLTVGAAPAAATPAPTSALTPDATPAPPAPVASLPPAPTAEVSALAPPPTSTPPPPASRAVVNLNTASAAQLEQVNGIGPVLARRIIEYRTRRGPFRAIGELDGVSGIGPKTLEKMRPQLTLE